MMIILPASMKLVQKRERHEPIPIETHKHHIIVCRVNNDTRNHRYSNYYTASTVYVFPRDKPFHFKNALQYRFDRRELKNRANILYFGSKGEKYQFFDLQHKVICDHFTTTAQPVAVSDGLIWWCSLLWICNSQGSSSPEETRLLWSQM